MIGEWLVGLLAALAGVLLDRLTAWVQARAASATAMDRDRLHRRLEAERINRAIDGEIDREDDLGALVDRL